VHAADFAPHLSYPLEDRPDPVVIVDLDLDGTLDLVCGRPGTDSAAVFLGSGSGSLIRGPSFGVGASPRAVAAGLLNGDSFPDVAFACRDGVTLLLSNGPISYVVEDHHPTTDFNCVAIGDFNADGLIDVAAGVSRAQGGGRVYVFLNSTSGFGPSTSIHDPLTGQLNDMATGDFNEDGNVDLVASCQYGVSLLFGNGLGGFARVNKVWTQLASIAVADFDRDGHQDLVAGTNGYSLIQFYKGNGLGDFVYTTNVITAYNPRPVCPVDVDGDGLLDLVAAHTADRMVSVSLGDGNGNFTLDQEIPLGVWPVNGPARLDVGDLDGNGTPDIVASRSFADSITVLLNRPSTTAVLLESVNYSVEAGTVNVTWTLGPTCESTGAVVERFDPAEGSWRLLSHAPSYFGGRVEFHDSEVTEGQRYGYRLATATCGRLGEIWIDLGVSATATSFRAEVRPNPAFQRLNVVFDLPRSGDASLELWDIQGRRVESRDVGALGSGSHSVTLGGGTRLAPGVYVVRLIQGDRVFTTRACLVE
jgi:FG-GAP-like repeat/FG-GAP repeat